MNLQSIYKKSPSFKAIWKISWPIMIANLAIPIVTATDTAVMGRENSSTFIAAIALGGIVFNIVYFSLNFLRMSTTGLVSQEKGKENKDGIKSIISLSLSIAILIGILLIFLVNPIINLSKFFISGSNLSEMLMSEYIFYRSFAAPATLMNMVLLGVFIGIGSTKSAMVQLIFISLLNAFLSIVFVIIFNLSVMGVALGTVFAQWAGLLLSVLILKNLIYNENFKIKLLFNLYFYKDKNFNLILNISKDFFIRTLCIIFAEFFLINNSAKLGNNSLAIIQIYIVFLSFISYGLDAFAHAAETLLGQSFGKKDKTTSIIVVIKTLILGIILAIFISIFLLIFGKYFFLIFTSIEDVINGCIALTPYLIILPLISVWAFMFDGFFIGAAKSKPMRDSTIFSFGVFLLLNFFIMQTSPSIKLLWISYLLFLFLRGVFLSIYFKSLFIYDN